MIQISLLDALTLVCALSDAADASESRGHPYTAKSYRDLADVLRPMVLNAKQPPKLSPCCEANISTTYHPYCMECGHDVGGDR